MKTPSSQTAFFMVRFVPCVWGCFAALRGGSAPRQARSHRHHFDLKDRWGACTGFVEASLFQQNSTDQLRRADGQLYSY